MGMDNEEFWQRTNQLIKESGYTQNTLTEKLNFTPRSIQNWSSRKIVPDAISAYKMAKALNTTVEFLVTGIKEPEENQFEKFQSDLSTLLNTYKK